MKMISTQTVDGIKKVPVYQFDELPYTQIMLDAEESKNRQGVSYLEIPCAFDIETTTIYQRNDRGNIDADYRPYAYMYHWQMCIDYRVVFGRTWHDFVHMLDAIERRMNLSDKLRLVIYVHNLPYETQFMRKFLRITDSFCKDIRKPLKLVHNGCIEFRCSYALSNCSLNMFCKNENAVFKKMVETYDYKKIRTSATILTEKEEGYCYNDVRGLCECIRSLMRHDTLATIPMTNTGYVRRDARNAMRKNKSNRRIFKDSALSVDDYKQLRAAFRGGDTHANSFFANQIVKDVTSYDIASSYPACMLINKFPVSKFEQIQIETMQRLRVEEPEKYCYLLHVAFMDLRCIARHHMPYIPLAKVKHISADRIIDNGRVKKANELSLWITDIDMDIIAHEYKWQSMRIDTIKAARSDYLPHEYRNVVIDYFKKKTRLKGLTDGESIYNYVKSKNRLNSLYGMMCMRIDQGITKYDDTVDTGYATENEPLDVTLDKYYKKRSSFLPYQWGVWVTAHARKRLHDMMDIVADDLVYVDTDSVKFCHADKYQAAIDNLNSKLRHDAEMCGAYADDMSGIRHYCGIFEHDGHYDALKTLGAKKYVVQIEHQCYSTIAGVSKQAGQQFFDRHGIDAFKIGAVIHNSGHLVAYYNDDDIHTINVDGIDMVTASNLALVDDTYTIGVTDDYLHLLQNAQKNIYDIG